MMINLTRRSKDRLMVDVTDEEGKIILVPKIINRFSEKDMDWLLKLNPEWNLADLNQTLYELCEDPYIDFDNDETPQLAIEATIPASLIESNTTSVEPFVIHVRDLTQLKKYGIAYNNVQPDECLREAFDHPPERLKEPMIEWDNTKSLSCLDIDYHEIPPNKRPLYEDLEKIVCTIKPQPFCWHQSHGRGCKLYYTNKPGFDADELASVAGLMWTLIDPRATFDLIKSTRHPCFKRSRDNQNPPVNNSGEINYVYGAGDLSSLRRLLNGEIDYSEIEQILSDKNWTIGQCLPHTQCPIHPTADTNECVFIGDTGIYCHRCYAHGFGDGKPGFFPYSRYLTTIDNRLRRMVKGFCHIEHARIVLRHLYPCVPNQNLETIYRVLLKTVHTVDDPRIRMCFGSGKGFIRTRGLWISVDGEHPLQDNEHSYIKSLPGTVIPKEDGFVQNVSAVTAFCNSLDLAEYGYNDITFIRGCKIYGQFLPYGENEIVKVINRPEFRRCIPQYLIQSKRMSTDDAWGLLEQEFPGIDRSYVRLLIAMKGVSEGRLAQCPYILVNGPTGAGKSTTVHIAAGICGDKADEPIYTPDAIRFRQSLMDSSRNSSFILVNEIFKNARMSKVPPTQALDPMLSLTEDSRSHVMYVGSCPFGRLPVFVMTDIDTPPEIEADEQLSRRFTFYRLTNKTKWSDTLVGKGIRPHEFRLISADHNHAADTILSEVIDHYFRERTSVQTIVKNLDIPTLQTYSEEVDNTSNRLVTFFKEVCKAPALIGNDEKRYPAVGWKKIERGKDIPLVNLWDDFCDGQTPELWGHSRLISSKDWSELLKVPFPVVCETRLNRNNVFIRFRSNDSVIKPSWVNGKTY